MADTKLQIIVTAKDEATKVIKGIGDEINGVGSMVGSVLKYGFMAGAAGVGLLTAGLVSATKAAIDSEFADAKMEQALKNSSNATADQVKELKEYAEALQFKVGISDEEIKNGISMLSTFKLSTAQIKKATPALIDMAAAYKKNTGEAVDLQQVSIMIGKATGGELYKNLQRVGVIFDDNQLKMLENADAAERVRIVTEELGNEFGGQALAQADTFGGKVTILGLYFDEFKEKVGSALLNALTPWIDKLMTWARSTEGQAQIQVYTDKIVAFAVAVGESFGKAIQWIVDHKEEIKKSIQEIWDKLQALIDFANSPCGKIILGLLGAAWAAQQISGVLLALQGVAKPWTILLMLDILALNKLYKEIKDAKKELEGFPKEVRTKFWFDAAGNFASYITAPITAGGSLIANWLSRRQVGGSVSQGQPYMVGEAGPEMFVPRVSGSIKPNNQLKGGGGVVVNIYGNINNSEGQTVNEIAKTLARQLELARVGGI